MSGCVREWSGGLSGCPGVFERPSRMSGNIRKWSGGPQRCPGVFERPSRLSGSCRDALPDVREWSGDPP